MVTKKAVATKRKTKKYEITFMVEVEAGMVSDDEVVAVDEVSNIVEEVWDAGQSAVEEAKGSAVYDSYTFVAEYVGDGEADGD